MLSLKKKVIQRQSLWYSDLLFFLCTTYFFLSLLSCRMQCSHVSRLASLPVLHCISNRSVLQTMTRTATLLQSAIPVVVRPRHQPQQQPTAYCSHCCRFCAAWCFANSSRCERLVLLAAMMTMIVLHETVLVVVVVVAVIAIQLDPIRHHHHHERRFSSVALTAPVHNHPSIESTARRVNIKTRLTPCGMRWIPSKVCFLSLVRLLLRRCK